MHPEIRQNGPGRCPRCGMDLVPVTPGTGAAGHDQAGHDHAAAAGAHEDHDPRHGGQLGMQGDVHIEMVIRPDGRHQVFLSDATRAAIPPERATNTSLRFVPSAGGAAIEAALRPDPGSGALIVASPLPATGGDFTVRVTVAGENVAMDFSPVPPGAASHPAGGHSHGSAHGGVVVTIGDRHLELRLTRGGHAEVWLLDGQERPTTARGVQASVRLALPSARDVPLSVDPSGDRLVGEVGAISRDAVVALVTITPAGGQRQLARYSLRFEGDVAVLAVGAH